MYIYFDKEFCLFFRLVAESDEMACAFEGLKFMWKHFTETDLVFPASDCSGLTFTCSLEESGITPSLLVNMGSALTVSEVWFIFSLVLLRKSTMVKYYL